MEFINNLKRKIKQAGIESKKYLADPNHPYHEAAGFLKFQIICGYISIVLLAIYNLMIIYYFFKFDFINAINLVGRYLGIAGSFITILLILYVVIDVAVFTFCIIFLKKLKNRDSDYLLFYHNMCAVCYVVMLIMLFFDFKDTFFMIIWFTIIVAVYTYYYCTSVKVRVYFGGDDFLKKDHYIHFLLEENDNKINNNDNTRNNNTILNQDEFNNKNNFIQNIDNGEIKNSIDSKDVGVVITNSQKSKDGKNKNIDDSNVQNNNKIKHDNISNNKKELEHTINNETKNNKVVETDSEKKKIARLSINSNNKVVSKQINSKHNKTNNAARQDNTYYYNLNKKKKSSSLFVRTFKFILLTIIKLIILVILVLTLINYNNKYRVSDIPFFKHVFILVDNISSNLFKLNTHQNNHTGETSNKKQINEEEITIIKDESINPIRETYDNNSISSILDETEEIVAEYREAIELSESIKKIDLKGAKWQFNKKQNAWNLILNNKISKDVIYIIDYINPITLKPCSSTYGFDGEGRMIVGWGIDKNGVYYYFDDDIYNVGKMCTGLKLIDDEYYYFLDNGRLLVDDYTPDGYYADINGVLDINDSNKYKVK